MAARSNIFSGYAQQLNREKRRELLKNRPGFMLYSNDLRGVLDDLGVSDDDLGKILRLLFEYSETQVAPELAPGLVRFAFNVLRGGVDRSADGYLETCIGAAWSRFIGCRKTDRDEWTPSRWFSEVYNVTGVDDRQRTPTNAGERDEKEIEQEIEQETETEQERKRVQRETAPGFAAVGDGLQRAPVLDAVARARNAARARDGLAR